MSGVIGAVLILSVPRRVTRSGAAAVFLPAIFAALRDGFTLCSPEDSFKGCGVSASPSCRSNDRIKQMKTYETFDISEHSVRALILEVGHGG